MGDTLRRKRKGTFTASYEHLKHLGAPEHYNMRVCSLKANYIKLQLWGGEIVVDGACVGSKATTNIKIYASRRASSLVGRVMVYCCSLSRQVARGIAVQRQRTILVGRGSR
jgi:hypothetical protein